MKFLVEEALPLREINETARIEAGFIRVPKISNLHPYLARRPTAPARALTLASVLPNVVMKEEFERALGLDKVGSVPYKLLYLVNPNRELVRELVKKYTGRKPEEIVVVDPMAGGGSIPLESLRLGFRTVAIDYNPVAYLILKATLEYPAKYGRKLYEDVKGEVELLIDYAKKELVQYYAEDAYNYIIARGYRCPNPRCKGLVPIVHSNKLDDNTYIVFKFDKQNRTFTVEISRSEHSFERLRCPYCGAPLNRDLALKDWIKRHKELLEIALSGDLEKAKEKIQELLETHIILVKETPQGFKPTDIIDKRVFVNAYLDLTSQINELREYLPDAQIPKENEVFEPIRILGLQYWYELFNPRQLLTLLKLLKYIKERAEFLVKERREYGAAIALYLALGLNKLADYNNIATEWHPSRYVVDRLSGRYQELNREVSLALEYCEAKRIDEALKWAFEPYVRSTGGTRGGLLLVLRVLSEWLDGLGDRVHVLCGDARNLSSIMKDLDIDVVDVVNVDPPYLAQHFYSDLMEFYWQFLRIALQPAIGNGYLFNRDPGKGRVELYVNGWSPFLPILPRDSEIIVRKGEGKIMEFDMSLELVDRMQHTGKWYVLRMWEFFNEVYKVLKGNGVLVVWFTHSDPEAWEAIISSLYAAGFTLSIAWPMWTEMQARRVALLSSAFLTSLALVLRKRGVVESIVTGTKIIEEIIQSEDAEKVIKTGVLEALRSAYISEVSGSEVFIMGLAGGIAGATRIWNSSIDEITREDLLKQRTLIKYTTNEDLAVGRIRFRKAVRYFDKVLYPAAIYIASETLLEEYLAKIGLDERMRGDVLSADVYTKAYLILWTATRYLGERELAYDFVEKICKILNVKLENLVAYGLTVRSARTSRGRQYRLLFGDECYRALEGRHERLIKTTAGQAIHILRLIGEQPKEDISRVVKSVLSAMPISRSVTTTALFLLRTANDEELGLVRLSRTVKGFVESVLVKLYQGV